jgi:hypothetical protein
MVTPTRREVPTSRATGNRGLASSRSGSKSTLPSRWREKAPRSTVVGSAARSPS